MSKTTLVTALDTLSGQVAQVPAIYLKPEYFGDHLVEVPEGTKSYDPVKYKAKTAEEYKESQKSRAKAPAADAKDGNTVD